MTNDDSRKKRVLLNIVVTLFSQLIVIICGFIAPRYILGAFGSELYGATNSITQFLSYIALLEGGIGGVARAALYKPIADNDSFRIGQVIKEVKHYFRILAIVFIPYVLILSLSFRNISHINSIDWLTSFFLVIVISISTFAQYYIGISYSIFLQAAQRTYINQLFSIGAIVANTMCTVFLINLGFGIITVKLASGIVFVIKPICVYIYVNKKFPISKDVSLDSNTNALEQKWVGLGQHIAYFFHTNMDVVILTLFVNQYSVAVYSVYYLISSHLQNLTSAFSTGMEALFGDMLAKKEKESLDISISYYETFLSIISIILFSSATVLIVPFVMLYTNNVNDADYYQPIFGMLLLIASVIYCIRLPYHAVIMAAGHFRQTQVAAYGEAILNAIISITLVNKVGIIGVALGTVIATGFRLLYYIIYLNSNIICRSYSIAFKRIIVDVINYAIICYIGHFLLQMKTICTYYEWACIAVVIVLLSIIVTIMMNYLVFPKMTRRMIKVVINRIALKR